MLEHRIFSCEKERPRQALIFIQGHTDMPRGFTTARLIGGPLDNHSLPNLSIRMIRHDLLIFSGSGFTKEDDEMVGVFKGASNIPANWLSCKYYIYGKAQSEKGIPGVALQFLGEIIVDRCEATTKAGTWCKNQAGDGLSFCPVHDK